LFHGLFEIFVCSKDNFATGLQGAIATDSIKGSFFNDRQKFGLISAICGGDIVADLLDQTNNPMAHRHITETILTADNPLGMERVIDRTKIPVGNGRTITLFKHIMECSGIRFVRGNYANV
jgi:hypothetical protein